MGKKKKKKKDKIIDAVIDDFMNDDGVTGNFLKKAPPFTLGVLVSLPFGANPIVAAGVGWAAQKVYGKMFDSISENPHQGPKMYM